MILAKLVQELEIIAPTQRAESWDNVGLLTGDPAQDITKAILAIDYTPEVAAEATAAKCDLVIAYHPPIFEALKRITAGSLVFDAIRRGVAIYSPHTALDIAEGGTNDMLADAVGIGANRAALKLNSPKSTFCKLVVFVPEKDLEKVASAVFAAGAGRLGDYSSCSFQTPGTGTFFGEEGADPAIGKKGQFERVAEIRFESIVPLGKIDAVIKAMRASHPYEEPAFDLIQLLASPEGVGMGRIGTLDKPASRAEVIDRIKKELGISHVLVAGPMDGIVYRAAVCAGACGNHLDDAIAQKSDLYVTGEMRHHDAIKAAKAGVTVVCTLHSNSERAVLKRVRDKLAAVCDGIQFMLSEADRDPFEVR